MRKWIRYNIPGYYFLNFKRMKTTQHLRNIIGSFCREKINKFNDVLEQIRK